MPDTPEDDEIQEGDFKEVEMRPDGLPRGFRCTASGIEFEQEEEDEAGETITTWVKLCSPLKVVALPRDQHSEGWGRYLEIVDPDGVTHRWAAPASLMVGDPAAMLGTLLELGLRMPSLTLTAKTKLLGLINSWTPRMRVRTTPTLGWSDAACHTFVFGDGTTSGAENVVLQQASFGGKLADHMRERGSLEDWKNTVARLAVGSPMMVAALNVAFGGVLLAPLNLEGGGIHLRGESSKGKSTLLAAAASVWGSPEFKTTWRATGNGLEGVAAVCNGTVLLLDEMGEVDAREAGSVAYMLGNGAGKTRAGRDGSARAPQRWKVAILSTGEISLADKMNENGKKAMAGQSVRLIDLEVTNRAYGCFDELHGNSPDGFARLVVNSAAMSYGTAGRAFVRRLLEDREEALEQASAMMAMFCSRAQEGLDGEVDSQVTRVIRRLSVFSAAGELATQWGITGWPSGTASQAMREVLKIWIAQRGGTGSAEAKEAVDRLYSFLLQHASARLEDLTLAEEDRRPVPRQAGWRNRDYFYLNRPAIEEIYQGMNVAAALKTLVGAGLIEPGDGRNIARRIDKLKDRPRAYCIPRSALAIDLDENADPGVADQASDGLFE